MSLGDPFSIVASIAAPVIGGLFAPDPPSPPPAPNYAQSAQITADASSKAAEIQAASAQKALDEQKRQYDTARSDILSFFSNYQKPMAEGAISAYNDLRGALGLSGTDSQKSLKQFFDTPEAQLLYGRSNLQDLPTATPLERIRAIPGYEQLQEESRRNIGATASARGYANSPRVLKEIGDRSTLITSATQDRLQGAFNNYASRLASITGISLQGNGANTGNNLAALATGYGNAQTPVLQSIGTTGANAALAAGNAYAQAPLLQNQFQQQAYQNSAYTSPSSPIGNAFSSIIKAAPGYFQSQQPTGAYW